MGLSDDEPFALQSLQGLAHRSLARAHGVGNLQFDDTVSGSEYAPDDVETDAFIHLVCQ